MNNANILLKKLQAAPKNLGQDLKMAQHNKKANLGTPPHKALHRWFQMTSFQALASCLPIILILSAPNGHKLAGASQQPPGAGPFPGVARDLSSFCSARPSLSVDLAPMLVHVKRNTSFNYKLYLFSNDEHVFQTGQIVPRDDFRIHSFPVKLKPLNEFFAPATLQVYQQQQQQQHQESAASPDQAQKLFKRVPSSRFNAKRFFSLVPLNPVAGNGKRNQQETTTSSESKRQPRAPKNNHRTLPFDVHGDVLPGDESFAHHDVAAMPDIETDANAHIQFDRDDQLSLLGQSGVEQKLREFNRRSDPNPSGNEIKRQVLLGSHHQQQQDQTMIMPVGSFSSFHLNLTYLVRKDFDQADAELVRARIDPQRFQVTRVDLLLPLVANVKEEKAPAQSSQVLDVEPVSAQDYAFLSHKLLRDPNTRITAISQVYEDWITRNFYTIVYIQRRLNVAEESTRAESPSARLEDIASSVEDQESDQESNMKDQSEIVTDRLIFRGSSIVLLGADQLDYRVKASAFITEKNGLHYYLEFLPNGKFYLGAIDWTKRPFKFIDSQRFPIKPTRTQFDNEELLLCPPSVCYSDQPVDELVSYGRLKLADKLQQEALIISKSSFTAAPTTTGAGERILTLLPEHRNRHQHQHNSDLTVEDDAELTLVTRLQASAQTHMPSSGGSGGGTNSLLTGQTDTTTSTSHQSESISLDNLIEAIRLGSNNLDVRLHLRDWVWSVPRAAAASNPVRLTLNSPTATATATTTTNATSSGDTFAWHYEWARRNEIKVTQDSYGFALVGHEIDASYRVFNELYLISANQLITINYTMPNETVTSVHPIGDEFAGLSSSLLDPITGAFYDRYSNQLFFIKGDRYVGYDYATKRPLEDFLLPPAVDSLVGPGGAALGLILRAAGHSTTSSSGNTKLPDAKTAPLVSSLPVVGILGRQHHVDAIWHDLHEDVVYVFSGMRFYSYPASDFKDGAFRAPRRQPPMRCINKHFLLGCRFDEAYSNPCKSDEQLEREEEEASRKTSDEHSQQRANQPKDTKLQLAKYKLEEKTVSNFSEEQQMKLRSIAARGGGLLDFLLENTLVAQGATRAIEPFLSGTGAGFNGAPSTTQTGPQERMVIYLLIAMVLITILVTVAMIIVVINWARLRSANYSEPVTSQTLGSGSSGGKDRDSIDLQLQAESINKHLKQAQILQERIAYPPAISQYLSKQYHQQQQQQQQQRQQQHQNSRHQNLHYHSTSVSGRLGQSGPHHLQAPQMMTPSSHMIPAPLHPPNPMARISSRPHLANGGQGGGPLGRESSPIVDSSAL